MRVYDKTGNYEDIIKDIKSHTIYPNTIYPNIIIYFIYDSDDKKTPNATIKKRLKIKISGKKNSVYELDSVVLRNNKKHHFSAYITCNGKEMAFDGAGLNRLYSFKWKDKLIKNKNSEWTFEGSPSIKFNFEKGYQILFYYRTH